MSIEELVQFCLELKGKTHKESIEIGKMRGVSRGGVETLRTILCYSDSSMKNKLSKEQRNKIAELYCEGDVSMSQLAKQFGVTFNTVRCLIVSHHIKITNNSYTRQQENYITREYKRGTPISKIAEAVEKSRHGIKHKIERMGLKRHAA